MRYLGLDLGAKTLGLSISDETKTIASPYGTINFSLDDYDAAIESLKSIVIDENIEKIILGLPKNMNNTLGERAQLAIIFKEKIERFLNMEVVLQDERLSTVSAHNYLLEADMSRKKRKKVVDKMAANIILQTYLDREKGNYGRKNDF